MRRTMQKNLSSKINNSIEKQMVTAASGGKLTIMKNKGDTPAYVQRTHKGRRGEGLELELTSLPFPPLSFPFSFRLT